MYQIQIKGAIIPDDDLWFYEWLDRTATAPRNIILPDDGQPIEVIINSGGGDVYAGSEIYTMLRSYPGEVTVKVVGIAASAASVIAMAGDVVEISPTAQLMIHNVSTGIYGDHNRLRNEAEVLEGFNQSIANSYIAKTGLSLETLLELMNQTTWFTADKAVEHGFADKVMFEESAPQLVAGLDNLIPSDVIAKFANIVNQKQEIDYDKVVEAVILKMGTQASSPVKKIDNGAPKGFGAFLF
ncbi:scaffolding protein [Streptococcus varani]|uniref:ATP-dependent Clp protease proteolytic subunit n=1 Tax=Streptococcus varani TaxID=1608583 RepID=A0A0E4CSF5_9STRE|nr:head maturation protease, ClpP-related [Streptococcus varani]CQR24585.1 scaffolding protein [Streptococcus varani]